MNGLPSLLVQFMKIIWEHYGLEPGNQYTV